MKIVAYYHEETDAHGVTRKSVGLENRETVMDEPLVLERDALAEIDDWRRGAKAEADAGDEARAECRQLRAELAALKAQVPVAWICGPDSDGVAIDYYPRDLDGLPIGAKLYAAPVSEAKAQGVVMPERRREAETDDEFSAWVRGWNACLDEVARLNAAPAAPAADAGVNDHD